MTLGHSDSNERSNTTPGSTKKIKIIYIPYVNFDNMLGVEFSSAKLLLNSKNTNLAS